MSSDLVSVDSRDWLVIGWFTPGPYKELAEQFAINLQKYNAPYHLFAKPAQKEWDTRRKPNVVLEAMQIYKGKTLILMDIDCIIQGDISPITKIESDVGIVILARNKRKGEHWVLVEASSRVVVFKPTDGAKHFAKQWANVILNSQFNHDEHSMVKAFLKTVPNIRFEYIGRDYSGREAAHNPNGKIIHNSAHRIVHKRRWLKNLLRTLEKPFRTGRTNKEKQHPAELDNI